jgi:hypothetical protein
MEATVILSIFCEISSLAWYPIQSIAQLTMNVSSLVFTFPVYLHGMVLLYSGNITFFFPPQFLCS